MLSATSQWGEEKNNNDKNTPKPQYHFFIRKYEVIHPFSLQIVTAKITCQCGQGVPYLT